MPRIVAKTYTRFQTVHEPKSGLPSAAQMPARHYRKIDSRAHASRESGLIMLWLKPIIQQPVADFSKTPHHELSRKIYTIWNDPWTKIWAIPQAPKCPLGILENRFDSARIPGKIILGLTNIPHTDFGWRSGWTKTPAFFLNFIRLEIFIGKLSARTASPSVKKYNRGTIWPNVTDTRSWKVIHGDVP